MIRNILIVLVICVLAYFGYRAYQHRQQAKLDSGEFTCQGCLPPEEAKRFDREDHGDTPDGNMEHKPTSARVAAEEAETGHPVTTPSMVPPSPNTYANSVPFSSPTVSGSAPMTNGPVVVPVTPPTSAIPSGMPATDSVGPNPANGMHFTGSGQYQWYRQGNLTWRVDTNSGRSCIIYATMEEWRKAIVMSHGCGREA